MRTLVSVRSRRFDSETGRTPWAALSRESRRMPCRASRLPVRVHFNVDICTGRGGTKLGAGPCLVHPQDVVIGGGVEIGVACLIVREVSLESGARVAISEWVQRSYDPCRRPDSVRRHDRRPQHHRCPVRRDPGRTRSIGRTYRGESHESGDTLAGVRERGRARVRIGIAVRSRAAVPRLLMVGDTPGTTMAAAR
jgi:hypothetical protein